MLIVLSIQEKKYKKYQTKRKKIIFKRIEKNFFNQSLTKYELHKRHI